MAGTIASKENPDALQPAMLLAAHYLRSGEKQKSLTLAQKLQGTNPSDPDVLDFCHRPNLPTMTRLALWRAPINLPPCCLNPLLLNSVSLLFKWQCRTRRRASDALKKALAIKPDYLDAQLAQIVLRRAKEIMSELSRFHGRFKNNTQNHL